MTEQNLRHGDSPPTIPCKARVSAPSDKASPLLVHFSWFPVNGKYCVTPEPFNGCGSKLWMGPPLVSCLFYCGSGIRNFRSAGYALMNLQLFFFSSSPCDTYVHYTSHLFLSKSSRERWRQSRKKRTTHVFGFFELDPKTTVFLRVQPPAFAGMRRTRPTRPRVTKPLFAEMNMFPCFPLLFS